MEKQFNTAGPVNQPDMYKIDPLKRWDLQEILALIEQKRYFILHAPRQSGKTSCLLALRDYLNKEGKYLAVYANFEAAQAWRNDVSSAIKGIVDEITGRLIELKLNNKTITAVNKLRNEPELVLNKVLSCISLIIKKPVVLFVDEIDALVGDTLISVLRQMRSGYDKRPENFPSTIILCGVRDIKDYRIHASSQEIIAGGSVFNIKTESLRLGNFSREEVKELYTQHTTETGQKFAEECFDLIMDYTDGQPWLVNALAREVTYKMKENRDRTVTITASMFSEAKERLILERQTHLDLLVDKLREERVNRIILPMIMGEEVAFHQDDINYCIDLGLIKRTKEGLQISNKIYQEIIPRELTYPKQMLLNTIFKPDWINPDGSLNIKTLLTLFKQYWHENAGIWAEDIAGYKEAAPHLVSYAFLQRVVNGGGMIEREYALGMKRVDLMVKWKYETRSQKPDARNQKPEDSGQWQYQNIVIEIKTIDKKQKYETVREKALQQTAEYAKICGEKTAYILLFDRDYSQQWQADEPVEKAEHDGVQIEIWKMSQADNEE
jgi:hypothetical protein